MKTLILTAALAAAALALGARGAAQGTGKTADETFLKEAAAANAAEVEVGQLAVQKATRPDVKSYAEMLVDDHTKANDELKGLAAQKNVTLPTEPKPEQKATKERLSKLSGDAFDRAFVDAMVADHQEAVALFSRESTTGTDPDAKAFAAKTLPKLEEHHTQAKSLASGKHEAQPHH